MSDFWCEKWNEWMIFGVKYREISLKDGRYNGEEEK